MLTEAIEYLITPCHHWSRRLGYLNHAVSLRARRRRWHKVWRPHLDNCRTLIIEAMARCSQRRRAVVLGSGLLMEVPLNELAASFGEVVLVDAVHLLPERWLIRRQTNVHMLACDVTGVAERLLASKNPPVPDAVAMGLPPELSGQEFDFAVSANMISQLPLLPLWYLERLHPPPEGVVLGAFARELIHRHLADLHRLAPVACLIADYESLLCEGNCIVDRDDLLFGATLPPPDREWMWELAPRPELYRRYDVRHRIVGHLSLP